MIDPDFSGIIDTSIETQAHMGKAGGLLMSHGDCRSENAPDTADIIYEVQENCFSSEIEKSPYPRLPVVTKDSTIEEFSLSLMTNSWDFGG